jgi:hypothetical protein
VSVRSCFPTSVGMRQLVFIVKIDASSRRAALFRAVRVCFVTTETFWSKPSLLNEQLNGTWTSPPWLRELKGRRTHMFESISPDAANQALALATRIFVMIAGLRGFQTVRSLISVASEGDEIAITRLGIATALTALAFATVKGLEMQRPWAKRLAYLQAAVTLLVFPFGTILGTIALVSVHRASNAGLFSTSVEPVVHSRSPVAS